MGILYLICQYKSPINISSYMVLFYPLPPSLPLSLGWYNVIQMGQIDCTHTDNRAICGLYHIEAFPTIKVVNNPITRKGYIIIQLHHCIHTNTILFGIGLTSKAIVNLLLSFFQKISILFIQLHCHINISNKCSIHPINILIWTPLPYSSRVHVLML